VATSGAKAEELAERIALCKGERETCGLAVDVRDREADPSSRHPAASSRIAPHRTPNRFAPELIPELVPDPLRFTFKRSSEFTQIVLSLIVLSLIAQFDRPSSIAQSKS
jgi:hypothetical protein